MQLLSTLITFALVSILARTVASRALSLSTEGQVSEQRLDQSKEQSDTQLVNGVGTRKLRRSISSEELEELLTNALQSHNSFSDLNPPEITDNNSDRIQENLDNQMEQSDRMEREVDTSRTNYPLEMEGHNLMKKALSLFAHWRPNYGAKDDGTDLVSAVSRGGHRQLGNTLRWG